MRAAARVPIAAGVAFGVLAILVAAKWSPLIELDADAVGPTTDLSRENETYRDAMTALTWALNSQLIVLYTALIAVVLARRGRRAGAIWLVLVVGLGSVVGPICKQIIGRKRPVLDEPFLDPFSGLSFPSGHAGSATFFGAALLVLAWPALSVRRRAVAVAGVVTLPLLSGWTRLTLGGHYLSDILGGILLGLAWVAAWLPALPALERAFERRRS